MAVVPDVCETSIKEPMPIDPLESSHSTATTELSQPLKELPSIENFSESKWKPLIGTPSKSPIPDNILVPDPSPARTLSDTASTIMPAPSTPSSFVHQRRQGEYVPRPPVWTIYNMDGSISTSLNPPGLMHLANDSEEALPSQWKRAPMLKRENRKLSSHNLNFSDLKFQDVSFDEKVMKMGEVFMDRPLMVNMMQMPDPPILLQPNPQSLPPGIEPSSRSVSYIVPQSDRIPPDSVIGDPEIQEDCSNGPNAESTQQGSAIENNTGLPAAAITNYTNSYSLEDPDVILTQPGASALRDESSTINDLATASIGSDVRQEPGYALIEGPGRSIERLTSYVDLRVRLTPDQSNPLMNFMKVGSFVTYVGLTQFSDSISGMARDFELPLNSRWLVADIYGDYWGLLVRLEPGLELGEIQPSYFLGRKSTPRAPERMRYPEETPLIGLRTDPKYIVYAPLCAFTLTANEGTVQSQTESQSLHASVSTNSYGGIAQAAIRSYSNDAEAEAVRDRFTFIPKTVYCQYVAHFDRSPVRHDPVTDRSNVVTDRPQPPSRAENRQPTVRSRDPILKSPAGTSKSVKNTPTQNIKDLFTRKKVINVVSVSSTARFDDMPPPGRATPSTPGDGSCSPGFIAACAPQIPPLSTSFQGLSLGPPGEPSDAPPAYFDSTRPRDSSSLRVRDTNLRNIPLPQSDGAASSRQGERQPPAEVVVPVERSNTRGSRPKSENTSRLTSPPSQAREQNIVKGRDSKEKRAQKGDKPSKLDAVARNAAVTVRKLMPALLGSLSKPLAKKTGWNEDAEHKNSARKRLIGPYKHAARSWNEFKEKRHRRKTILPQHTDPPSPPSNEFTEGRDEGQGLRNHQESSTGDEDADRRMQTALIHALTTDADAQLRRRVESPMPTYNSASDADDEQSSITNVGPGASTRTLPIPGHLGNHLLGIAPDRTIRDRLTASVEQL
ncbi:hypothetical protein MMC22_001231 [Lobaria immixta]|nr:hypothetical protein [Lobaria immixta]